jgi:hypothetical protein
MSRIPPKQMFNMSTEEGQREAAKACAEMVMQWGDDTGRNQGLAKDVRKAVTSGMTFEQWQYAMEHRMATVAPDMEKVLAQLRIPYHMFIRALYDASLRRAAISQ